MEEDGYIFPASENIEKKSDKKTWFWTECLEDAKKSGCKIGTTEFWLVYKIRVYETHGDYKFCVAGTSRLSEDIGVTPKQVEAALMNACQTKKLFHIWSDKKVYRNKTKIYVTRQWLEEKGLNPQFLTIMARGKRNSHYVTGTVLENGEVVDVKAKCLDVETKCENVETKCRNLETKCQNVVSKCENVETKCENVVSPRMNKLNNEYKRISKRRISKKEQLEKNYEIVCSEFEDEELRQSWWDFLEMRLEQHNKTYTEKGIKLKIKEFKNSIGEDIELGKAALDQAVAENWVGWHINDSTKLLKNGYQADLENTRKDVLYKPKDGDDITYKKMFEKWKQYLGTSLKETDQEVAACKELLDDLGEEWVEKLIVALRMRGETNYVMREIKAIQDFVGLANNRSMMMSFYNEHRREWELKIREAQTGKKPWEL